MRGASWKPKCTLRLLRIGVVPFVAYDVFVNFLIDGNNVMHALAAVGVDADRAELTGLLAGLAAKGDRVHVVYDGPAAHGRSEAGPAGLVRVTYSGKRTADELMEEIIAADTAPRRLNVVSTDYRIRRAARKRRCRIVTSEEFASTLHRAGKAKAPRPDKPDEKQSGLGAEATCKWLREFGIQ